MKRTYSYPEISGDPNQSFAFNTEPLASEPPGLSANVELFENDNFSFNTSPPLKIKKTSKSYAALTIPDYSPVTASSILPNTEAKESTQKNSKFKNSLKSTDSNSIPDFDHTVTIRSNGVIDEARFPGLNDQIFPDEVESQEFGSSEESPQVPVHLSEPRIPSRTSTDIPTGLRNTLLYDRNILSVDSFQEFMEERLVRFRVNESQHNPLIEKHPFQAENFGKKPSGFFDWMKRSSSVNKTDDLPVTRPLPIVPENPSNALEPDQTLEGTSASNSILPLGSLRVRDSPESLTNPYTPNALPFPYQETQGVSPNQDSEGVIEGNTNSCFSSFMNFFTCQESSLRY